MSETKQCILPKEPLCSAKKYFEDEEMCTYVTRPQPLCIFGVEKIVTSELPSQSVSTLNPASVYIPPPYFKYTRGGWTIESRMRTPQRWRARNEIKVDIDEGKTGSPPAFKRFFGRRHIPQQKNFPIIIDAWPASADHPPQNPTSQGVHTVHSPIVGIHQDDLEKYASFAMQNTAFLRLGTALYFDNPNTIWTGDIYESFNEVSWLNMIPSTFKGEVDSLSLKLYDAYCIKYSLEGIVKFGIEPRGGITNIKDPTINSPWQIQISVNLEGLITRHQGIEYHTSPYFIALHELGHGERIKPLARNYTVGYVGTSIYEIGPVIDQIINTDTVYKMVKNIPLEKEVSYPKSLPTDSNGRVNLGFIANTFRDLKTKYRSIEAALMSQEGKAFVKKFYFDKKIPPIVLRNLILSDIDSRDSKGKR